MSRNLVIKQMYTMVSQDEKRVIDTNSLVKKRVEEWEAKHRSSGDGFVPGLYAKEVEVLEPPEETEEMIAQTFADAREEATQIVEQAKQEAANLLAETQAQVMQMLKKAQNEAEVEKNRIIGEAKQRGYQEGRLTADEEARALREEYETRERQLEEQYEELFQTLEPQLVDVITDIYEHIFHVELRSYREILSHLVSTTLRKIEGGRDFIIHVSKEDYPYVSMQKKQILAGIASGNTNIDVVEDLTLSKNDCMIETEGGIFDCGLGAQMSELKQKLLLLAWSKEE